MKLNLFIIIFLHELKMVDTIAEAQNNSLLPELIQKTNHPHLHKVKMKTGHIIPMIN